MKYKEWITTQQGNSVGNTLQFVNAGIDFHIPHVWAYQPIIKESILKGYFFIDRDTGDFEKAKQQLALLTSMGLFTMAIGVLLTIYLTKMVSKPLIKISKMTRKIAKGDFDIELSITGEDGEVGQLAEDIHIMTRQQRISRFKQQFISHLSHDLRTLYYLY
ncbi:HAMP domain-containing protein [Anaerobacillus sp. HL2]|nr:HAMP domain-containing protein [Anaerobacillus sp. HL2]